MHLKRTIFLFLAGSIGCGALGIQNFIHISNEKPNLIVKTIPEEFLELDVDGKILYGFKKNIRNSDLISYTTLKIPDSVEVINDMAFAFMFDGITNTVSNLILNKNLKTIGNCAFKGCLGLHETNLFLQYETG